MQFNAKICLIHKSFLVVNALKCKEILYYISSLKNSNRIKAHDLEFHAVESLVN